jgi:hypothetical protein
MKKYKGYYIDGVVFRSQKEIDNFLKEAHIKKIKVFHEMLFSERYSAAQKMELTRWIHDREVILHDEYKMTWDEIEEIPYTA